MAVALHAAELYKRYEHSFGLSWLAGDKASERAIAPRPAGDFSTTLVGYFNAIRPHSIQIFGSAELDYLATLKAAAREALFRQLAETSPLCVIVSDGRSAPAELLDQPGPAVFGATACGDMVIERLRRELPERLAEAVVIHGVFMDVFGLGVLITGPSGVGKSELALASLRRGHRLIADDAPEFVHYEPGVVRGRCPNRFWGLLEVRDLGILNVPALFGYAALKRHQRLDMIVRLEPLETVQYSEQERLSGTLRHRNVFGVEVPEVVLHPGSQRDLSAMFETAVRSVELARLGCPVGHDLVEGNVVLPGVYV